MSGAQRQVTMAVAWAWVAVPFAYGLFELVLKAKNLFSS